MITTTYSVWCATLVVSVPVILDESKRPVVVNITSLLHARTRPERVNPQLICPVALKSIIHHRFGERTSLRPRRITRRRRWWWWWCWGWCVCFKLYGRQRIFDFLLFCSCGFLTISFDKIIGVFTVA